MIANNSISANLANYAKILLTFSYANSAKNMRSKCQDFFIYLLEMVAFLTRLISLLGGGFCLRFGEPETKENVFGILAAIGAIWP